MLHTGVHASHTFVGQTEQTGQPGRQHRKRANILIVGSGIAGLTAAVNARRAAPDTRIMIVSEQSHPTINTPALKQFAVGKLGREQLAAYPAGTERASGIQMVYGRVEEIHAQEHCILLAHGEVIGYDSLLLATGSVPTGLPLDLPGRDYDGVLTLHRLRDYLDLCRRLSLREVKDVVVVGGGIHAAETVMCMLQLGLSTHWLIRGKTLLSRTFDQPASALLLRHLEQRGAHIYTETTLGSIIGSVGVVTGVVTGEQQMIACQLVLACTGSSPDTRLASHCTQPILHERKRGMFVNDQLHTNVPGIYAAGDVAALRNPLTSAHEQRAQWYAAVEQGHTAAAMLTGAGQEMPFFGVPWHATRIGELSILTVGNTTEPVAGMRIYIDASKGGYRRLAVVNNRLVGYLALGSAQPDGLAVKCIVDEALPLNDTGERLLKGTFETHHLLSQRRARAVNAIHTVNALVETGMVPAMRARAVNV